MRPPTGRDFYDLAIGNVPFGQYQVNDPAYNQAGLFTSTTIFFAKDTGSGASGRCGGFCHLPLYHGRQAVPPKRRKYHCTAGRAAGCDPSAQQCVQSQCRHRGGIRHPVSAKAGSARWTSCRIGYTLGQNAGRLCHQPAILSSIPEMVLGQTEPRKALQSWEAGLYRCAAIEGGIPCRTAVVKP